MPNTTSLKGQESVQGKGRGFLGSKNQGGGSGGKGGEIPATVPRGGNIRKGKEEHNYGGVL